VPSLLGIDHDHRPIIQYQPFFFVTYGEHCMICLTIDVAYDHKSQIIRDDSGLMERDVFYDCVVLTITGSVAQGRKRRRPEIVNTVLGPIAHGLDAQVHRAINLAQPGTALALQTKFNDGHKASRSCRTGAIARTARRERPLFGENAGLKLCPLCRHFASQSNYCLQAKWSRK